MVMKTYIEFRNIYYCYKCKIKFCQNCVKNNFYNNTGKAQFIDQKHNLLYFKTRNLDNFKNIDKFKLGNDLFSECTNNSKLTYHSAQCNGCGQRITNSPRYLCLHCNAGKAGEKGYHDYCISCIEHMNNGDEVGKKIQEAEELLYNNDVRLLRNDTTTYKHDNNNHIYLMIALQYNCNDEPYYEF